MEDMLREQPDSEAMHLNGARILIVEDQAEVAHLLVIAVTEIGGEVIAVASSMQNALALIRSEAISIVILTKVVAGVHSDVLARELVSRDIPYVVTACTSADRGHPEMHAALTITKPFLKCYVQSVLVEIMERNTPTTTLPPEHGALPNPGTFA